MALRHCAWAVCMAVVLAISVAGHARAEGKTMTPREVRVRRSAEEVGQYERLELTIDLGEPEPANPFDPREIDLAGAFHAPSGQTITVPAFYYLPYERSQGEQGREVLTPAGAGQFRIRFAGREAGLYTYDVVARGAGEERTLASGRFRVNPSKRTGYVRIGEKSRRYFELDSGHPYLAIGENMCWPDRGGTYDYDTWMGKLAAHGGNYIRLWLVNDWNQLGLENRSQTPEGDENGLGRYTQQPAWRVDHIVETGEQLGVRALMCIDSFNSLSAGGNGNWDHSPYNAANGGPCQQPADFFVNPEAKRFFKQRLRYLVARWGYSTSVLGWEFWNEVDLTTGYDSGAVAAWHKEMAGYLRSIDPWRHPITTSYSQTAGDPQVDALPQLDFVQSHNYGARDVAGMVTDWTRRQLNTYRKPYYLGEYGASVRGSSTDPEGVQLHNGLWAGLLSGGPATAMLWYWDWVEEQDLYHEFAPVAAFAADVNWATEDYRPIEPVPLRYAGGAEPKTFGTLVVDPTGASWEDGSPLLRPQHLVVGSNGTIRGDESVGAYVHGAGHANWRNPVTFDVDYPQAGRFEVVVTEVSRFGGAGLTISLDGREALSEVLQPPPPRQRGVRRPQAGPRVYGVAVAAGKHQVVVDNRGQDWFRASYRLVGYLTVPSLRVLALGNCRSALVWVQNREHTWPNAAAGEVTPVAAAEVTVSGLDAGAYTVEQWDTYAARVTNQERVESCDGAVTFVTPDGLSKDIAYRVRRAEP
jgi:hypothetical protein